jgi:hypothetical protein
LLAVVALGAVGLTACANQDSDRGDVVEALETAGATSEQAECVGDRLTDEDSEQFLEQDQLNDLAGASDLEDLDDEVNQRVQAALDACLDGSGDAGSEDTTDTTDASEGSTTTDGE